VKFTNPKNDLSFKKTFGNEKHKNILISFLNAVLDFKADKEIVDVEKLKETILDINSISNVTNLTKKSNK